MVKGIKCSKCGTINDAKSKFCKNCGASLVLESTKPGKIKCPLCDALNDVDSAFCTKCGATLTKQEAKPTPPANNNKSTTIKSPFTNLGSNSLIRSIGIAILFIAVILAFIGIFGDVIKMSISQNGMTVSESYNSLSYFFKDCWETLRQLKDQLTLAQMMESYRQYSFETVIHFIAYLLAFIGVIGLTGYLAYSTYNAVSKKQKLSATRIFKMLVGICAPYLLITAFFEFMNQETIASGSIARLTSSYGWGTTLLIVSLFFGLVGYLLFKFPEAKKKEIFGLTSIVPLLMLFCIIFGVGNNVHFSEQTLAQGSAGGSESIFAIYALILGYKNEGGALMATGGTRALFVFSIILMFVLMACIMANILTKNNKRHIVFSVLVIILSIISAIMINNAIKGFTKDIGGGSIPGLAVFAPNFIVNTILGVISAAASIFALALEKRQQA